MHLENNYTDIFTELDDSIFTEGSIDPMGLRMIWTSLGNNIFHNRLNTVSTNIRFYTLNLFHHAVIREVQRRFDDKVLNLTGKAPYDNPSDLYDGIIIFLECLLAHIIAEQPSIDPESPDFFIPGVSKLRGILRRGETKPIATQLPVDKNSGILERHIMLGIHGRHKGPFQQMGILYKQDYYVNRQVWDNIMHVFQSAAWQRLFERLVDEISRNILRPASPVWIKLSEVKKEDLVVLYHNALKKESFQREEIIRFWEQHLGLSDENTTAGILYRYIQDRKGHVDFQEAFQWLARHHSNKDMEAIITVEPLLICVHKVMDRLLQRGTTDISVSLLETVTRQLNNRAIDPAAIDRFLAGPSFNPAAQDRLRKLLEIYRSGTNPHNPADFIHKLIGFHQAVMDERGNLPWITISASGSITQHRSFSYSESMMKGLENHNWVNDYYFGTVLSLYKGMYQ
jgi:hypothetical protein